MSKGKIILACIAVLGVVGILAFNNSNTENIVSPEDEYVLSVPNLSFEITFPAEPQFNRTDGADFTRHSWSYIDYYPEVPYGRVGLFVQAENNLYAYNSSQEEFIEQIAQIYGGVVTRMDKDPNVPATDYEITGMYSNSSQNTETIVGRIVDVGEWTFNITNQFESENRYPDFIGSFKEI